LRCTKIELLFCFCKKEGIQGKRKGCPGGPSPSEKRKPGVKGQFASRTVASFPDLDLQALGVAHKSKENAAARRDKSSVDIANHNQKKVK